MTRRNARAEPDSEIGSGNVYRDIGFPDADEMLVKAKLVAKISEILRSKGLTQTEASRVLGIPQPKLSGILRGHFRGVSERKLIDCLNKLGRDVEIVVKEANPGSGAGKLTVVFG